MSTAGRSFFQTRYWGEFKRKFGWTPLFLDVASEPVLVLVRCVAPLVTMGYVPHAPEEADPAALCEEVCTRRGRAHLTFLRIDPLGATPPDARGGSGYRKAPVDVQPPRTTILDLEPSEDELLSGMKSKTRYNVRLAGKRGVTVRQAGRAELDLWYDLYRETASRDRIAIHSREYYQALFDTAADHPDEVHLDLYMAEHEGDVLGGIIVGRHAEEAVYLYGASANAKRNLMAPYLLQWEAIRAAKAAGARRYDLFGIPPADDPNHPMHGLYRFKVGFGGDILERPGSYDRPFQPFRYALFRRAEGVRQYYYKVVRKRIGRGGGGVL
ncbi:MAG: lipid II:glycine glycyltransferase FemX [Spirochaetaceae bacterium]